MTEVHQTCIHCDKTFKECKHQWSYFCSYACEDEFNEQEALYAPLHDLNNEATETPHGRYWNGTGHYYYDYNPNNQPF